MLHAVTLAARQAGRRRGAMYASLRKFDMFDNYEHRAQVF
jgi:UDP-N-acetylmuramoylalanine-D-glutamate ligase